jgi:hypothetical protein
MSKHLYRLVGQDQPVAHSFTRLTAMRKLALPQSEWAGVAARIANGESLRVVARTYGISHESVRRITQAVNV